MSDQLSDYCASTICASFATEIRHSLRAFVYSLCIAGPTAGSASSSNAEQLQQADNIDSSVKTELAITMSTTRSAAEVV
jgi:hypothetical protein